MTTKVAVQDWTGLSAGDLVQVFHPKIGPYTAIVDTKTADSSVLWVYREGGDRRAFDAREGIKVTPVVTKHSQ